MHLPWLTYIKERFSLPVHLLLSVGIAWHAQFALSTHPSILALILGPCMIVTFLFCLRLMDEVKDYHKDVEAHPDRPLPRGLISKSTAQRLISTLLGLQALAGVALIACSYTAAGAWWLLTILWLYLMYVEFFCGTWLEKRPFFYAVTHQIILLPLVLSTAHLASSGDSQPALRAGVMILGAFFSYEIARKLDPKAHPILRTYRLTHGRFGALGLMLITTAVAIAGTLWKTEGSIAASRPYICTAVLTWVLSAFWGEAHPKRAEAVASVSLLVHIWGPVVVALIALKS